MNHIKGSAGEVGAPAPLIDHDPLLELIRNYRNGVEELNAIPDEVFTRENEYQIYFDTYGRFETALDKWDAPALSLQGALEALKLIRERDMFDDTMGDPLLNAAIGYLEKLS